MRQRAKTGKDENAHYHGQKVLSMDKWLYATTVELLSGGQGLRMLQ